MRTKIILVCLFSLISLFGCNSAEEDLPDGIIKREKMIDIIADVQLVEAAQKQLTVSTALKNRMRDTSYHIIFNKYGIDSTIFDSSLRVYTRHPELMGEMMEEVAAQLNKEE